MAADVSKNNLLDQPMQIIHAWVNFTLVSPEFSVQFRRNQPEKTPEHCDLPFNPGEYLWKLNAMSQDRCLEWISDALEKKNTIMRKK